MANPLTISRSPNRLLIAQALAEPLRLLTRDKVVSRYSDTIVAV
jgi:PIN domain nuclease of toxin-antitoxin system